MAKVKSSSAKKTTKKTSQKTEEKPAKKSPSKKTDTEKQAVKKSSEETFSNDEVKVIVTRHPHCKIELEVHTKPELIRQAEKQAIKSINKEVSISGFRKGKAPEAMIRQKYPEAIEDRMQKSLADLSFVAAQKLAKVPVLNQNTKVSFDVKDKSKEKAVLAFSFETEPTVPVIDAKKFKPKKVAKPKVGTKQVDEAIRQIQFYHAKWTTEDRAVKEGDYIIIDLENMEEKPPLMVFEETRFEVSKEQMADWMRKLVIGMKPQETKEGTSVADKDASEKEKKEFKPKKVRLTVKKIETAELPKLDDEFAKKAGSTTIDEMKKAIEVMLNKQADEKVEKQHAEQVNEFLLENYNFELPLSLIESEKTYRKKQMLEDPRAKQAYEGLKPEEKKKREEEIVQQSIQAVQLFYLSRKFVQDAKISITHNQIHHEAMATMQAYGATRIDPQNIPKELYALSLSKVILAKTQEYIIQESSKSTK